MTPKEAHDIVRNAVIRSQGYDVKRPPTMRYGLADIIYAYSQKRDLIKTWASDVFKDNVWQIIVYWNLRDDNLNAQSDETVLFLANLLGEK